MKPSLNVISAYFDRYIVLFKSYILNDFHFWDATGFIKVMLTFYSNSLCIHFLQQYPQKEQSLLLIRF